MTASSVGCGQAVSLCISASSQNRCVEHALEAILRKDCIPFTANEQEFRNFQKIKENGIARL